jgi:hypothetical protein
MWNLSHLGSIPILPFTVYGNAPVKLPHEGSTAALAWRAFQRLNLFLLVFMVAMELLRSEEKETSSAAE